MVKIAQSIFTFGAKILDEFDNSMSATLRKIHFQIISPII